MESANASLGERTSPTTICTGGGAACGITGGAAVATGSAGVMAATCVTKGGNGWAAGASRGLARGGGGAATAGCGAATALCGTGRELALVGATAGSGVTSIGSLSVHGLEAGRGRSFGGLDGEGATAAVFALPPQPLVVGVGVGAGFAGGCGALTAPVVTMVLV